MRVRFITTCALGLAAALTLSSTLAAQSQDTTKLKKTTSAQRIPISKESPGEVVTVRVDTVYVTRHDTVTTTILRIDTVTVTAPVAYVAPKIRGPFYWAVFGGATEPWGNVDRLYTNGFHAGGAIGLESQNSPIGFRLSGAMNQIGREQGRLSSLVGTGTPLLLNLGADLKAKAFMTHGWAFYGVAGVDYNRYKRIATVAEANNGGAICGAQLDGKGGCYIAANDASWNNKFGWDLGLGTDFHIGSQDMFLEARYTAIQANGARTYFVPISIGVRYF